LPASQTQQEAQLQLLKEYVLKLVAPGLLQNVSTLISVMRSG
jgi:hypothetical protein